MSKYILLVEDDEIATIITCQILENLDCKFDRASNGKEAIELATKNKYSLILMDLGLPILDGIEACKKIRLMEAEKSEIPGVPIVALTANQDPNQKKKCIKAGMIEVIHKPLTVEKALEIFNKFVENEKNSYFLNLVGKEKVNSDPSSNLLLTVISPPIS